MVRLRPRNHSSEEKVQKRKNRLREEQREGFEEAREVGVRYSRRKDRWSKGNKRAGRELSLRENHFTTQKLRKRIQSQ